MEPAVVNNGRLPNRWFYLSAYAIAVKHGYKGTESEFINDLMNGARSAAVDAANSAESALQSKDSAINSASDSEAFGKGTRGGEEITDPDDPAYHANAAYYAEQANESADAAENALSQIGTTAAGVVADWLDEHIDPESGYVLDDTLTVANAASDAAAVGAAFKAFDIKYNGAVTNVIPHLPDGGPYTPASGITYQITNGVMTLSGTAASAFSVNILNTRSGDHSVPFESNHRYYVRQHKSGANTSDLKLEVYLYKDSSNYITCYTSAEDGYFDTGDLSEYTYGTQIRYYLAKNKSVNGSVCAAIFDALPDAETDQRIKEIEDEIATGNIHNLLPKPVDHSDVTIHKVTWSAAGGVVSFVTENGPSDGTFGLNIITPESGAKWESGRTYYVRPNKTGTGSMTVRVNGYIGEIRTELYNSDRPDTFIIDDVEKYTEGIYVQYYLASGNEVNCTMSAEIFDTRPYDVVCMTIMQHNVGRFRWGYKDAKDKDYPSLKRPDYMTEERMLQKVRAYKRLYSKLRPDFLCLQEHDGYLWRSGSGRLGDAPVTDKLMYPEPAENPSADPPVIARYDAQEYLYGQIFASTSVAAGSYGPWTDGTCYQPDPDPADLKAQIFSLHTDVEYSFPEIENTGLNLCLATFMLNGRRVGIVSGGLNHDSSAKALRETQWRALLTYLNDDDAEEPLDDVVLCIDMNTTSDDVTHEGVTKQENDYLLDLARDEFGYEAGNTRFSGSWESYLNHWRAAPANDIFRPIDNILVKGRVRIDRFCSLVEETTDYPWGLPFNPNDADQTGWHGNGTREEWEAGVKFSESKYNRLASDHIPVAAEIVFY